MTRQRPTVAEANTLIRDWFAAGLRAVDPRLAVERHARWDGRRLEVGSGSITVPPTSEVVAIAIGKAATEMARALTEVMGDRITSGIILTKDGHAIDPPSRWKVFEASHPVPDVRGCAATVAIVEQLEAIQRNDVAIVLISGGGSALLESPRAPLTLADIQHTTRLLLNAGAPIQDLNAVRSELSMVKGGGLRRAIGDATCVSLILSDVLGNDPSVIASGPTIERDSNRKAALELLATYHLIESVPAGVIDLLRSPLEEDAADDMTGDIYAVIGDNKRFVDEIANQARAGGYRVEIAMRQAEGEARELATRFIDVARERARHADVVIGGGEATVTVRGNGSGGRNTEFALAAATILNREGDDLVVASLASDGQDGSIDAAGAIVDQYTIPQGSNPGLDAERYLDNNDSGGYLEQVGALVRPGPTGTNVNDVYIAVRVAATD